MILQFCTVQYSNFQFLSFQIQDEFQLPLCKNSIVLATNPVDIEVVVDSEQIKSIQLINTSESIETMYPLITASLNSISSQVIKNNSTENITYNQESKYTSLVLIEAIQAALDKARND